MYYSKEEELLFKKEENALYKTMTMYWLPKTETKEEIWNRIKTNDRLLRWAITKKKDRWDTNDIVNAPTICKHILSNYGEVNKEIYEEFIQLIYSNEDIARLSVGDYSEHYTFLVLALYNANQELTYSKKKFAEKEAIETNYHYSRNAYGIEYYILNNSNWTEREKQLFLFQFWDDEQYNEILDSWECGILNEYSDYFYEAGPEFDQDDILDYSYEDMLKFLHGNEEVAKEIYHDIEFNNMIRRLRPAPWLRCNDEETSKLDAIVTFPDFITLDYGITDKITLEELERQYLNYCKTYFINHDHEKIDTEKIINAYNYLREILKNRDVVYENKREIVNKLKVDYDRLIENIKEYYFQVYEEYTHGGIQNSGNRCILKELSYFNKAVNSMLENINKYFENITKIEYVNCAHIILYNQLKELDDQLKSASGDLYCSKLDYEEAREEHFRGRTQGFSRMEHTKEDWRKNRNQAAHTIVAFNKSLKEINDTISPSPVTREAYDFAMNRIRKSEYYYCYLSEKERAELEKGRKQKVKKIII